MNVRKALGISAVSQMVIFAVNFGSVIVVSRLLTPAEIGIFSVSAALLTFAHIFREFGVGHYLIQARDLTHDNFRAAFTVTLGISWSIAGLLFVLRIPLSRFYGSPGIAEVLALISVNFVLLPFGSPLLSLMRREMQFGRIAIVNTSNAVVSSAVTIGAALAGMSYLSMAWGAIAGITVNVVMLNIMRRGEVFMLPTTRGLRDVIRFGSMASTISALGELGASAPDLILGRTLGFAAVGYFSRANGLRKMALGQTLTLVRGVYFPSFAEKVRGGQDPAELYAHSITYVIAFTAPALSLLALLAAPLILFLFGPQWSRAAPLSSILCAASLITTPTVMTTTALMACGRVSLLLRAHLLILGARLLALSSSIWLELEQVVILFGLSSCIELVVFVFTLRYAFDLRIHTLWRAIRHSLLLIPFTLAGPILIQLVIRFAAVDSPPILVLTTSLLTAAAGWAGCVVFCNHPLKAEFALLFTRLTNKKRLTS